MFVAARDDDLPRIVSLMNRAYRGAGSSAGWNTEAGYIAGDRTTEALLRTEVAEKPDGSLLKYEDCSGILRACVWLEPLGEGGWYLGSLAIDPDLQNAGLGRSLLAAAEHWIAEKGGARVRMSVVNVREALIAWYLRRGYRSTGETIAFPYGDNRFGTPLRDDLCFVVLEKALTA
ncbi:GNAT family N-acetyltransferase [Sphingomonas chungangi]|nr:GNAT family N-acetyltransferase [Sphingomonas chungangi]